LGVYPCSDYKNIVPKRKENNSRKCTIPPLIPEVKINTGTDPSLRRSRGKKSDKRHRTNKICSEHNELNKYSSSFLGKEWILEQKHFCIRSKKKYTK
jgi:hypothetical protein